MVMSKEFVARIDKLAEKNGRNRSQEIIFALRKYVEDSENYQIDNNIEYPVVISPKTSPGVKEELLTLLYDKDIIDKIKKISHE